MSSYADPPRSLHVVAVCHQLQPQEFAARLRRAVQRHGVRLRGVVVSNNRLHHCPANDANDLAYLSGTNELLDFSGYLEGIEYLVGTQPLSVDDNVMFVNDSLFTKHAAACILHHLLSLDRLLRQLRQPAICGKWDPYRSVCLRNPWSGLSGFVTTFCFMLNAQALSTMRGLREDAQSDGVLVDAAVQDDAWGRQLNPSFREFIRAHVAYADSPYRWPSAHDGDPRLLWKKACCVYFESRLSGAIDAVLPINAGPRSRSDIHFHEFAARAWRSLVGRFS